MKVRVLPSAAAWALAAALALASGCDGSSPIGVSGGDGGGSRPVDAARADGSSRRDAGTEFDLPTVSAPMQAPPMISPTTTRLLLGRARTVGTHLTGCSNDPSPADNSDRWCAFDLPRSLGRTELWVVNLTKALAGTPIKCDQANPTGDPNCRRLTENLWTGQPLDPDLPSYPTVHRFDGDTLIYHADAVGTAELYRGPIYAWRPEWPEPKRFTSDKAISCTGHARTDVAVCIEDVSAAGQPAEFSLTVGRISAGAQLPVLARINPVRANNGDNQWRSAFSADGQYFAYSSGGKTVQEPETLYVMKTDDIAEIAANPGSPKRITVGAGITRWSISLDSQKWYYFRNYNYNVMGEPKGTLTIADFPSGANELTLAENVGVYQLVRDGTETDRGLGFFDAVARGLGTFKMIRDRAKPADVKLVVSGIPAGALLSNDGRLAYFIREIDDFEDLTDAHIARTDGSGSCRLTGTVESSLFGDPFLPGGGLVFWADRIDTTIGVGEGWLATPQDCGGKRKFSDGMDYWFLRHDGMVFSDEGEDETATLKYAPIVDGKTLGQPVRVQERIRRLYAVLPSFGGALFTINRGLANVDGLYFAAMPFGTAAPPPPPPAGTDAAAAGDTAPSSAPRDAGPSGPDAGATAPDASAAEGGGTPPDASIAGN